MYINLDSYSFENDNISMIRYMIIYLCAASAAAFTVYGADKLKAKKHLRRVPERILILLSLIGGAAGGLAAMQLFRHKTRKAYFYLANIAGIVLWGAVIAFMILRKGGI